MARVELLLACVTGLYYWLEGEEEEEKNDDEEVEKEVEEEKKRTKRFLAVASGHLASSR